MELSNAKALVAKIASDPEVAKIFSAITSPEAFADAAKKYGYTCTLDEFKEALKTSGEASEDMSDAELAQTSGGLSLVGVDYAFVVTETVVS